MKRVLIVGCPGAGKSTLANELAEATRLHVIHLDRHYWLPGWERPDSASWQKTVEKLAAQSEWIMDRIIAARLSSDWHQRTRLSISITQHRYACGELFNER